MTGLCEARDAGIDAGSADAGGVDAGVPDSGVLDSGVPDAGSVDAGFDAGLPDAGAPDAGMEPVDAGCGSNSDCFLGSAPYCDPSTRECVECFQNSQCPSSVVPVCDLRASRCVGCVAGANCANPLPVCDATQQCVQCTTNAECGAGRECNTLGECAALNDTCATARAILPSGSGGVSISAEPGQGIDDTAGSCNTSGPELVYSFTTTSTQSLTVAVSPLSGSAARPVVYLRSDCGMTQLACDAPTSGSASLSIASLPAGSYFLFVESANGAPGRVSLNVSLQPPTTSAPNTSCATAQSLGADGTTTFRSVVVGNTVLGANVETTLPTCSATARGAGNELWYSYTLAAQSNVTVVARPISGSTLRPVISMGAACANTGTVCQAASAAVATQVSIAGQPAGTYSIMIDSADGTTGAFQLELDAVPVVANDACSGATALSFTNDSATATGNTAWATNGNVAADQTPSCSDSARGTGRDVVFSYTLSTARDVTIAVTPTGANPTYQPVISVRSSSCSDATRGAEQGCVSPVAATAGQLSLVNQPAGTYFVWVDGSQDTSGPFQVEVVTGAPTPPPANDTCATPEMLTFTNDVATVVGSTLQAANDNSGGDVSPTCNPSAKQSGRDVVYSFTLSQPRDVRFQLTPTSGSTLIPVLYVRRGNCTSQLLSDEVTCQAAIGGVDTSLTRLAAGTYFVFVDSSASTRGGFQLTVTQSAATAAPANDSCAGAQSLQFSNDVATVTGSLVGADNSNSPTDNAPACGTDFLPRRFGRDVVYAYTLTTAHDVDVTVTPVGNTPWFPTLYVRAPNQCASFSAGFELTCVAETASRPLRIYLPNQAAGTYFLHVDSNSYERAPFTLQVARRAATPAPSNDTCTMPTTLAHGAAVQGDTKAANDNFNSLSYPQVCRRGLLDARDVVYAYTATTTGTATAVVTPEAGFNPALLLLQNSCAAAQCVRFADAQGAGVPESFSFPVTQGATYFLVVDSVSREVPNAFGSFSIRVQ
ncbi:MAG: hypothetical protein ACO1OB_26010 [Archangium sp.]